MWNSVHLFFTVILLQALLTDLAFGQQDATATFNMLGVTGTVTFSPSGDDTQAIIDLSLSKSYSWEITEFPVIVAQDDPCNDAFAGARLHDLSSNLARLDNQTESNKTLVLFGVSMYSGESPIVGRTLLLKSGDDRVCASILPSDHQVSYALVNGHVAGHIYLHKIGDRYAVVTDLFNTQSTETRTLNLNIYNGHINVDLPEAESPPPAYIDRCNDVSSKTMVAAIRNVPIAGAGSRQLSIDYISVAGEGNDLFDFSSGYVKIQDSEGACANIHSYTEKSVQTIFSVKGVQGHIRFAQSNPYQPTIMDVSLKGLNKSANGYHVHEFPIGYKYTVDSDLCGPSVTGGHFTPLPVSEGPTQDYAEIGDLSRKHGSLQGRDDLTASYEDWYLPLFGVHSIVGRSIVIHADDVTGSRWVCANIGYPGQTVTAVARFGFFAEGTMTFTQEKDKPWSDVTLFVDIANAGLNQPETMNHNFHIHMTPVNADAASTESRCKSASGHWNPFEALIGDTQLYSKACSKSTKLGCEVGDTSAKFGTIDLAGDNKYNKYMYTDINVALSGAYTIIGRSVTIHDQNRQSGRYACADITEQLSVKALMSSPDNGYIRFSESEIPGVTSLDVNLTNLQSIAGGYHVHETTLNTANPGENICATTGAHLNPFGIDVLSSTNYESLDGSEVGDLSNKFGMLNDLDSLNIEELDTNLPLRGNNSMVGRSVVIHRASDNSRWKCFDVGFDTESMGATLIQGMAIFKGAIDGRILLTQAVTEDGVSDVIIDVLLSYKDGKSSTNNHNWHVHVDTYDGKSCLSVGGHYNPFDADLSDAEKYARLCGTSSALKCEMGDLSGKLGKVDVTKTFYGVYTDNFLTLIGNYSVLGRSIVVHDPESGAGRMDCADIVPYGNSYKFQEMYINRPTGAYRDDMAAVIARQLGVPARTIYVSEMVQHGDGCAAVRVYFTGMKANDLLNAFDSSALGKYSSVDQCNTGVKAAASFSLWLVAIAILASILNH